jgi:hypothetical protein
VLVSAPWFLRAWIVLGNPVFPAFPGTFGTGWADPDAVLQATRSVLEQSPAPRGPLLGIEGTLRAVFDPRAGFDAPAWVLALLPAAWLAPKTPERRALLVGAVVAWATWAWFVPVVRFGLGVWAWGAVAATVGAARLARDSRVTAFGIALATAAIFVIDARVVARRSGPRIGTLVGLVSRDGHAERQMPQAWTEARIARPLPHPVGLTTPSTAWVGREAVSLAPKRNGVLSPDDYADPARLLARLRGLGVASVVLRPRREAAWVDAIWSASDAWAADGRAEVADAPEAKGWRVVRLP